MKYGQLSLKKGEVSLYGRGVNINLGAGKPLNSFPIYGRRGKQKQVLFVILGWREA